jgi:hypothetical protein
VASVVVLLWVIEALRHPTLRRFNLTFRFVIMMYESVLWLMLVYVQTATSIPSDSRALHRATLDRVLLCQFLFAQGICLSLVVLFLVLILWQRLTFMTIVGSTVLIIASAAVTINTVYPVIIGIGEP